MGWAFDSEWTQRAVIWSLEAPPVVLDGPPGWIEARAINDQGLVVGLSGNLPVAWSPGEPMRELGCVVDLGHLNAVDATGTAVGSSDLPDYPEQPRANLWYPDGSCVALGNGDGVGSRARQRNVAGEVVGSIWMIPYGPTTAVHWDSTGVAKPLSDWAPEGWTLIDAVDINARGDILCLASDPAGVRQPAILWKVEPAGMPSSPPSRLAAHRDRLILQPNPSVDAVTLRFESEAKGAARIRIFGADGRIARELTRPLGRGGTSLRLQEELSGMGAGIYLVNVEEPDGRVSSARMVRLAH